jgi:hypothetical protein
MTDLQGILRSHQAFCEISYGHWQLGKEDANLDGFALPPKSPVPGSARTTGWPWAIVERPTQASAHPESGQGSDRSAC